MLPVVHRIVGGTYVFQQDSAPAHRARYTDQLLQTPEFIAHCTVAPDLWKPNSLDLNPVDYHVWGLMQDRVYRTAVRDTSHSWPQAAPHWDLVGHIPQTVIDETIDEWATTTSLCQS